MAPNFAYSGYGAISADVVEPTTNLHPRRHQKQVEVTSRLLSSAAVACMAVFFVGRFHMTQTAGYSHAEVYDIASRCDEGEFIGGCEPCTPCEEYMYNQGGCTYFKDTTCNYCEVINDCPRENLRCTTQYDQTCVACTCNDPVVQYTDIDIRHWKKWSMQLDVHVATGNAPQTFGEQQETYGEALDDATSACYWGVDCTPCTVCAVGETQVMACDAENDTVCAPCTVCSETEWTQEICTYLTDTVCQPCDYCQSGFYTQLDGECRSGEIYELGQNATCIECTECVRRGDIVPPSETPVIAPIFGRDNSLEYVSQICDPNIPGADTTCTQCTPCDPTGMTVPPDEDGNLIPQHVAHECQEGRYAVEGEDTICVACGDESTVSGCSLNDDGTLLLNEYEEPVGCEWWVKTPCQSSIPDPIDFQPCASCQEGFYEKETCGLTRNTVCEACADAVDAQGNRRFITHCPFKYHSCDMGDRMADGIGYGVSEVRCSYYPGDEGDPDHQDLDPNLCGEGGQECSLDACDAGYLGPRCDYMRIYTGCGTHWKSIDSDERSAGQENEEGEVGGQSGHFIERTAKMGRTWYNDDGHTPGQSYKTTKEAIINYNSAGTGEEFRDMRSFMVWCMDLCDEYPECTAFELDDDGTTYTESGPLDPMTGGPAGFAPEVKPDTQCRLYNGPTNPDDMVERDCYANIRRQSEADIIDVMRARSQQAEWMQPFLLDVNDNGTPDDTSDDCSLDCGSAGEDCTSRVWCPSKNACIESHVEPCPLCDGPGICSDGYSTDAVNCSVAHCTFNDGPTDSSIDSLEACLNLCGEADDPLVIGQAFGSDGSMRVANVLAVSAERCPDDICEVADLKRCKWYEAGEAQFTENTCDPNGCGPNFQYCYLEDECIRSELLETEGSSVDVIRGPHGCNNGDRFTDDVGYDDSVWYGPQDDSGLLYSGVYDREAVVDFVNASGR